MLKNGFKRNRPQDALTHFTSVIVPHDQFSFPSGHTSAAFLMATLGGVCFGLADHPFIYLGYLREVFHACCWAYVSPVMWPLAR